MITPELILFYQKHITNKELIEQIIKFTYDSDENDSSDDFETVSNQ